jgi:sporulation protein YlmC with PRC-barrel domain
MNISHIVSAAVFALMLGAPGMVIAQQTAPATTLGDATGYLELGDMHVVNPAGEKVGEVEEVLMDTSGNVVAVVVEAGGFLGIGDHDVIVQLDQLRLENKRLVTTLTKEQVEALPKWE